MYRVCLITVSDSSALQGKKDLTGPAVAGLLTHEGYQITEQAILPDERELLAEKMRQIADGGKVDLLLTLGGTGLNERDVTPEATGEIIEKTVPGFPELMRRKSFEVTPNGILSRGISGIRKHCLIINLPGSPKAAVENLSFILQPLDHGLQMLTRAKNDCAHMDALR
ncbi:MogA/MoaB family molybdenum cofactor biosynthesis protein [Acidaminococcus sp. LBK-2]|uniref:MogA/MoaB family molybdenum cofactor biosynthesis protein n=1 Tax=Acidaminococcus sp. LBK-2 TaxID=3456956 RepID=UPI003FA46209